MTAPYDAAALSYLESGWPGPIPVFGKNIPAKGATGLDGTVTEDKVRAWLNTDMTARARAGRGSRVDNIALRHQGTVAIDVDAGYGDKDGVRQLAAYAARLGLPPLPATWSSTARGPETGSRQYVYRVAEAARFKTKPCKSVELCCWHHRFTVCWPSVHPDTKSTYTWYEPGAGGVPPSWGAAAGCIPRPDELPMLPDEWFRAFRGSTLNADRSVVTVEVPELLATFRSGEPDIWVQQEIDKWADASNHLGHDETMNALIHALMLGREGHPGVPALYRLIVQRFTDYVTGERPRWAEKEVASLVEACATFAQQKPLSMPTVLKRRSTDATPDELDSWLTTFTANNRPGRLVRHLGWMLEDRPRTLRRHAERLVVESIAGNYPAEDALLALVGACQHHGVTDPDAAYKLISVVLGDVLSALEEVAA